MPLPIKSPKNFWTGILYIAFGTFTLWGAQSYPMGTASRMGAGFFPTVLSLLLMFFGILAIIRSLMVKGAAVGEVAWKPIIIILGSTVIFGLLLHQAGLVISLLILILTSAIASSKFRFDWKMVSLTIGLTIFCSLVFVKGLGIPIPLFGDWFVG